MFPPPPMLISGAMAWGGGGRTEKHIHSSFLCSQLTFLIMLPSCFPPLPPSPHQTNTHTNHFLEFNHPIEKKTFFFFKCFFSHRCIFVVVYVCLFANILFFFKHMTILLSVTKQFLCSCLISVVFKLLLTLALCCMAFLQNKIKT